MALINAFLEDLATETQKTLTSPRRLLRFWRRVHAVRAERRARGREAGVVAEDEGKLRRVVALLTENRDMLQARLRALKGVASLQHWLNVSTKEGYGRLDAFGIGRDELFGSTAGNSMAPNAPVSLPHIWGMEYTRLAAVGRQHRFGDGAQYRPGARRWRAVRSADVREHRQHSEPAPSRTGPATRLTAPAWPASFPVDPTRAARGKALFVQHCAPCHETYKTDGVMRTYQLFSFAETGTDPLAAINFELPVLQAGRPVQPFPYAAVTHLEDQDERVSRPG